ncbi:carboxypeptidase-like regulatory domain-containing protein [Echinicola sp. CAU 1574]|uniref:Carboxypeptidase-like regulatory domain-containing protein n=1 Tax=Echinicola arenosa TaxID=2774144 RepID=A0ABR9APQ4_9BACT|nr:carboxypeptidase-like regulatory domain-containing protein [Echinicola arenosa]MBD8489574.1 carboxypeptidase-like regulatory domain-containing protein [Echinicola arenosa]
MKVSIPYLSIFLFFALLAVGTQNTNAQNTQEKKVIQLSGIILNADSTTAVAGVNVYVPTKGRGTSSNHFGYFSMPVAEGDSVVFSFVGLKNQTFKVPQTVEGDKISLVLTMVQDEIALGEIEVMPYPTEEEFKQAVLAMNIEDIPLDRGNLSPQMLLRWAEQMPASGNENFRAFQSGQMQQIQDRYGPRSFPLLNPFAWAEFIKSIKRGDLKSKD